MKKKYVAIASAAAVLVAALFIPPVQAAAVSALSVFRVSDAKTITISVADLQELAAQAKQFGADVQQPAAESEGASRTALADAAASLVKPLEDAGAFTAFPISLPQSLRAQTPKLYSVASYSKTFTLDTAKINAALAKLKADPLSDTYNGVKLSVTTPPAAIADYQDVALLETQGVSVSAPGGTVSALWSHFTGLSVIPADLRSQLRSIDPTSRDVYLPVIEGLGRAVDLGVTTGYLYAAKDLAQVTSALPELAGVSGLNQLQSNPTTVLIWTKNGVLYALAGQKSDSELSQIARTVR